MRFSPDEAPVLYPLFENEDRVAVLEGGKEHTFFDLQLSACMLAGALARLQLEPGNRVAALLPNSFHAAVSMLAAARAGCSYFPLNTGFKPAELQALLATCDVRAIVCRADTVPTLSECDVPVIAVDEILADAEANPPAEGDPELDPDEEFLCLSTSGSTGAPRIVTRTARAVDANARHVSTGLGVSFVDRFLSVVPFWHANGFSNCLLMPLFGGASIIPMERFLPRSVLEAIVEKKPSIVVGSPFVFQALSRVVTDSTDFSHVRAWISSGAAIPEELDARLRHLGIPVRQLYGSSETGTISISSGQPAPAGCVGKPLPGVSVRIVDEDGFEAQPGQTGELQVASGALFSGYIGVPEDETAMTEDGYYRMGDLGWQDLEGDLYLSGRADAMINISGVKVDPVEIQQALCAMPGVTGALVFGASDSNGLETIKAMLVAEDGITTEKVLSYCRERLAEYKLPRTIEFVDEIPQDLMGKTPRSKLEN